MKEHNGEPESLLPKDEFPAQSDHPDLHLGEEPALQSQSQWPYLPKKRNSDSLSRPAKRKQNQKPL